MSASNDKTICRAMFAWTGIHNCHDQLINGVFGGPSQQGNENRDIGARERIAVIVAAIFYQALLHRTSCNEDRSFEFRVGFSRYIRRICVSQYRVTSERNLRVTPSFRRSSPHLSRYLLSAWVTCHSGCLPHA
jgi:hypothetical protein